MRTRARDREFYSVGLEGPPAWQTLAAISRVTPNAGVAAVVVRTVSTADHLQIVADRVPEIARLISDLNTAYRTFDLTGKVEDPSHLVVIAAVAAIVVVVVVIEIVHGILETIGDLVDLIFATRTVHSAAVEIAVELTGEFASSRLQAPNRIVHVAVIAVVTAIRVVLSIASIRIVLSITAIRIILSAAPLRRCNRRNAYHQE